MTLNKYGQEQAKIRLGSGDNVFRVEGELNQWQYLGINGNQGNDEITASGWVYGDFFGGKGDDRIFANLRRESVVNGNNGNDVIIGSYIGNDPSDMTTYRGGRGDDLINVGRGIVYGDQGIDTFQISQRFSNGFEPKVVIKDFEPYIDVLLIDMKGGDTPTISYSTSELGVYVSVGYVGSPAPLPSVLLEGLQSSDGVFTTVEQQSPIDIGTLEGPL